MQSHRYRPDIEGLRAIAVLAVVGFHASPNWITGGFVGVDVFFVISGYLITRNICTGLEQNTFGIGDFYSRRVRRIFPALCLVLLFSAVVGWFYMLALEYRSLGKHIAGAASFVENILYYNEQGYFDESSLNKPLLQLWSLGVEEQFYFAWPLLLWWATRARLKLPAVMLSVIVLSFICNIYGGVSSSVASFFLVQSRIWELALGGLIALPWLHHLATPAASVSAASAENDGAITWKQCAHRGGSSGDCRGSLIVRQPETPLKPDLGLVRQDQLSALFVALGTAIFSVPHHARGLQPQCAVCCRLRVDRPELVNL